MPEAAPEPALLNVTELVTEPAVVAEVADVAVVAEVAVEALPLKVAVIVPAEKLPEASRRTIVEAVLAVAAVIVALFA